MAPLRTTCNLSQCLNGGPQCSAKSFSRWSARCAIFLTPSGAEPLFTTHHNAWSRQMTLRQRRRHWVTNLTSHRLFLDLQEVLISDCCHFFAMSIYFFRDSRIARLSPWLLTKTHKESWSQNPFHLLLYRSLKRGSYPIVMVLNPPYQAPPTYRPCPKKGPPSPEPPNRGPDKHPLARQTSISIRPLYE